MTEKEIYEKLVPLFTARELEKYSMISIASVYKKINLYKLSDISIMKSINTNPNEYPELNEIQKYIKTSLKNRRKRISQTRIEQEKKKIRIQENIQNLIDLHSDNILTKRWI